MYQNGGLILVSTVISNHIMYSAFFMFKPRNYYLSFFPITAHTAMLPSLPDFLQNQRHLPAANSALGITLQRRGLHLRVPPLRGAVLPATDHALRPAASVCGAERSRDMAAVRSLRVSVKPEAASDRPNSDSDSDSERDAREPEPMEVEEGEIETENEAVPVRPALKEFMPVS